MGTNSDGEVQVRVVKITLKGRLPLLHLGFVSRVGSEHFKGSELSDSRVAVGC